MDQPTITTFRYDAFISYRHASPDDKIAEALHRALEEYVVPRSLVKRGFPRRLSRVFRDREELPTSNSLSDGIREALAQSRVLIVVCSRHTPSSKWIAKEIEIFKSLGRHGQILSLLIEGEPEESFPPLLREARQIITMRDGSTSEEVEEISPLAADVRAGTVSESLRLLKNEKLRLLAPILGCSFDDLKQRHRQRVIRRVKIASALALLGIIAGAGTGFGYWSTHDKVRTEYFANYVWQSGHAKGIGRLTPEQVSHRENSLKFYVQGGRVEGFDVVNGYGGMTVNNSVDAFIGNTNTSNDVKQEFQYKWEYNTEGRVTKMLAFDRAHHLEWTLDYNGESEDIGHYRDKSGYSRPRTGSGADCVRFTRGATGYDLEARFTNSKGDPEPDQDGVFGWKHVMDSNGLVLKESYVDRDGQLMLNRYGYARRTVQYDAMGNEVEWEYFGLDGKPTADKFGVAKQTVSYDRYGRTTAEEYFDKGGAASVFKGGYTKITYAYDARGNTVERAWRDAKGQLAGKAGFIARLTYTYDDQGHKVRVSTWEASGERGKTTDGYSQIGFEYDSKGYQNAETFLDAAGNPIAAKNRVARETWAHDGDGNENQLSFFGLDGKPVPGDGGFATMKTKYDAHSNKIEESYLGIHGEPASGKLGYAMVRMKYDDHGGEIEEDYLDGNGSLVRRSDGYAKVGFVRDEYGRVAETSFYEKDGSRTVISDGMAIIEREYDNRGNQTVATAYGLHHEPRLNTKGFHRVTRTYDQYNNVMEEDFWDLHKRPVMTKDGYARRVFYYDERGNTIAVEKFDASGKSLGKESTPQD